MAVVTGPSPWVELSRILGVVEPLAIAGSLAALLYYCARPRTAHLAVVLVATALTAITVAQPLGAKATAISREEFRAGNPHAEDPNAIHELKLAGLPIVAFRPYSVKIVSVGDPGEPVNWFALRTWIWPALFTNGAHLFQMCGATNGAACWTPQRATPTTLRLVRAGGEWRYEVLQPNGADAQPDAFSSPYFRLSLGVTSNEGLIYWCAALGLSALCVWRRRSASLAST